MTAAARGQPAAGTLPSCYSLRRVNPFLGVVAVVRSAGGRALSFDGRHWQLQVMAHPPRGLWSGGGHREELRYFHFGVWSEAEGLTRVPLNPILDVGLMLDESERLLAAVTDAAPRLPFPLLPELELWLLDRDDAPLALLATVLDAAAANGTANDAGEIDLEPLGLDEIGWPDWSAGARGERAFRSETLAAQGLPERDGSGLARHAEALEQAVAAAAGSRRQAQWFRRHADGGRGIDFHAPPHLVGRRLPQAAFPTFGLRQEWPDAAIRALVDDYLRWLSPYLLTLPDIDDSVRAGLERDANRYALAVSHRWRLYPRVLDPEFVRRARVEANLRRAHPQMVPVES